MILRFTNYNFLRWAERVVQLLWMCYRVPYIDFGIDIGSKYDAPVSFRQKVGPECAVTRSRLALDGSAPHRETGWTQCLSHSRRLLQCWSQWAWANPCILSILALFKYFMKKKEVNVSHCGTGKAGTKLERFRSRLLQVLDDQVHCIWAWKHLLVICIYCGQIFSRFSLAPYIHPRLAGFPLAASLHSTPLLLSFAFQKQRTVPKPWRSEDALKKSLLNRPIE